MEVVAVVGERDFRQSLCGKVNYDFKSTNAARTAAITKAEKVQSLPLITFSTSSTTSLGNLIVLLTVGGVSGILNLLINYPSVSIAFALHLAYGKISNKYALQMQCIFDKMVPEVIPVAEFCLDCWNKLNETNDSKWRYVLSWEKEPCEECGQYKRVIITERRWSLLQRLLSDARETHRNR